MVLATIFSVSILGFLSLFQAALAFGAPLGHFAWGGQHRVLSRKLRIGSTLSIFTYFCIGIVLLSKSGLYQLIPQGAFLDTLTWAIFVYFVIGIFLNAISRSKFERYTMTPTVTALAVCTFIIIQSSG